MNTIEVTLLNTGLPCFIKKDEISAFYHFKSIVDGYDVDSCVISLKSGINFTTLQNFDSIKKALLGE
ncbi:hypothetical protein [Flavobacterium panacis]|uniref:hypothetical protein n=1 Tax=Flavobacterium panacis TaxID=2962567 RepID=UPI00214D9C0F|nr:hypothetical protein [Flavobacterium panacis]MCR4029355.1 hypothetical protein [Flavobacterium panacis]